MNPIDTFLQAVYSRLQPEQIYEGLFQHDWHKSKGRWRGKCPWHDSKSGTSFYMNPDSLMWRCPQCEVGGTPIQYLHQVMGGNGSPRGKAFIEAAKFLGDTAGVEFPEREMTPEQKMQMQKIDNRRNLLETVATYCHNLLLSESKKAIAYLTDERGFTALDIEDLGLGIFPSADRAAAHLLQVFSIEDLEENGILYRNRDEHGTPKGGYYAPLEGYITIPWADENGRPLTIYGRYHTKTPPQGKPKTTALRNPGTGDEVWLRSKRSPLYLDRALADNHRDLVVVEGVFDAALLQARGDSRVVAWVAANPSQDQIETLVKRRVQSVTFCLDPDGAGDKGTRDGIKHLAVAGVKTYCAPVLPDKLDPDEFVIANDMDAWRSHIDGRVHGLRFEAQKLVEEQGLPLTDAKLQAIMDAASEFSQSIGEHNQPELDVFFWPTLQEQTGVKISKPVLTEVLTPVAATKTTKQAIESTVSQDNGYAELRLAITGALLLADPIEKQFVLGKIASRFGTSRQMIDRVVKEISVRHDTNKTSFNLKDLMELGSKGVDWLIPRFLPRMGLTLLGGFAKDGKSTITYEMIASLLTGRPFLGEAPNSKARVLFIQLEENEYKIREKLDGVGVLYNPEVMISDSIRIERQWAIDDIDTLERWIAEHRANVVIIDSLRAASRGTGVDENSAAFANPVYELQAFLNKVKVSGYLIHHFSKNKEAVSAEKFAGTSALPGSADNLHLLIRDSTDPNSPRRQLSMSGRDCKGRFQIEYVEEEFPNFKFELIQEVDCDPAEKTLKQRILNLLMLNRDSHPKGMIAHEIREGLMLPPGDRSIYKPLSRLVSEKLLTATRVGKDKRTQKYSLPTSEDSSYSPPLPPENDLEGEQYAETFTHHASQLVSTFSSQGKNEVKRSEGMNNLLGFSPNGAGSNRSQNNSSPHPNSPVENTLDEEVDTSYNPGRVRILEDCSSRFGAKQGGDEKPPVTDVGGYARYRMDAQPVGVHLPAEATDSIATDHVVYKVGDRVNWRGQPRQIERIEQGDKTRIHLGLNQWADVSELEPIAVEFDDDSIADAAKLLKEAAETNDPAFVQDLLSWEMFTSLTPDSKQRIWGRLTEAERAKINELNATLGSR